MFSLATTTAPHAAILGNHDAEALMTREDIIQLDSKSHLSVTPPPDGSPGAPQAGNYWLNVRSETHNKTALRLWMLDSMNRGCGGVPGWCAYHLVSAALRVGMHGFCCSLVLSGQRWVDPVACKSCVVCF
jgi:hypothetical protein